MEPLPPRQPRQLVRVGAPRRPRDAHAMYRGSEALPDFGQDLTDADGPGPLDFSDEDDDYDEETSEASMAGPRSPGAHGGGGPETEAMEIDSGQPLSPTCKSADGRCVPAGPTKERQGAPDGRSGRMAQHAAPAAKFRCGVTATVGVLEPHAVAQHRADSSARPCFRMAV